MDDYYTECPECGTVDHHPVVEIISYGYGGVADYVLECGCGHRFDAPAGQR